MNFGLLESVHYIEGQYFLMKVGVQLTCWEYTKHREAKEQAALPLKYLLGFRIERLHLEILASLTLTI